MEVHRSEEQSTCYPACLVFGSDQIDFLFDASLENHDVSHKTIVIKVRNIKKCFFLIL